MRPRIGRPFLLAQYNHAQCTRYDTPCPTGDHIPVGHLAGKDLAHLHGGSGEAHQRPVR